MSLDAALDMFYAESQELLEAMDNALLRLEEGEYDKDILNDIFRSAHTIKGSAGIFALDHIVEFTHVVENVLDRARDEQITIEKNLLNVLFKCRDHISMLVNCSLEDFIHNDDLKGRGIELLEQLNPWAEKKPPLLDEPLEKGSESKGSQSGNWHISLRLSSECLKNGMDPMSFINFLGTIGTLNHIETLTDGLPGLEQFDPENLYLAYEISLNTDTDRETIENAFTFVQEDSLIRILPPDSAIEKYLELIENLPEENQRLGEILIKCGALSLDTLNRALQKQVNESAALGQCRKIGAVLVEDNGVPKQVVKAAVEKQKKSSQNKSAAPTQLIRIEAERLDKLINLIGELVISRQRVDLLASETHNEPLMEAVESLCGFTEQLRDTALNLRMVPIGSSFQRFKRIVRDTAQELGKEIDLVIEGSETELDRLMVEKLTDPLTHIVRNAMDHGIESVEARRANQKSDNGTLKLAAFHDAGHVVIEVSDDGGGIVPERILAKAIEKGVVDEHAQLSEQEILQLVFHPGFSTASEVTNLSGRGVGMDVVKRNVESLQGYIDIHSVVGVGTTFRIRLPLTLAIIDGFHVRSGDTHFIIPQASVVECTDLSAHSHLTNRNCINLRGAMIPYLRLSQIFNLSEQANAKKQSDRRKDNLLVVQFGEDHAGIVVDELQGEIQTVVKPLGSIFKPLKGISGSTLLGNGEIAFILDVPQLIEAVIRSNAGIR